MQKLKRVVIKEELVALTGDFRLAIVLGQMIYWAERVKDIDQYIEQEKRRSRLALGREEHERAERLQAVCDDLITHGWIYKSAEELSEETMMGVSKATMGRYLDVLVEKGWLQRRKNPSWKGDNTFQYRVDLIKIQTDLHKLGYALEGYPILTSVFQNKTPAFQNDTAMFQNETSRESSDFPNYDVSKLNSEVSKLNNQFQNETTLPEITTENNMNVCMDGAAKADTIILNTLAEVCQKIRVEDTVTLYDHHFADIYTMLRKNFIRFLDPEIIRIAGRLYQEKAMTMYNLDPRYVIKNPVGWFYEAYQDAIIEYKASRYKQDQDNRYPTWERLDD